MHRSIVTRLMYASLALGMTATPAVAGKKHKKNKKRARTQAVSSVQANPDRAECQPRKSGPKSKPRCAIRPGAGAMPGVGPGPRTQTRPGAAQGPRLTSTPSGVARPRAADRPGATSVQRPGGKPRIAQRPGATVRPGPLTQPRAGDPPRDGSQARPGAGSSSPRHLQAASPKPGSKGKAKGKAKGKGKGKGHSYGRSALRPIDRAGSFAVGAKGGLLVDTDQSPSEISGDTGYGLVARYRPIESFGIEGSWMRHEDPTGDGQVRNPLSLSAQLFAFPQTRLSPYVSAGATFGDLSPEESVAADRPRMSPHAGLGLEIALGRSVAFDVEARYLSQMQSIEADPAAGGALQATAGILIHF